MSSKDQTSLLKNGVSDGGAKNAPASVGDNSGQTSARSLVAYFVDIARIQNGVSPPRRIVGQLSKEVGMLIKEGLELDHIEYAIDIMVEKGLDPSALASCVFTAQSQLRGMSAQDGRDLRVFLAEIKDRHGIRWPTGSRWVHSVAAGTFVRDALGCDAPQYNTGWGRPSREEVLAALRDRRNR